jgi:hypothetical protein
VRGCRNNPLARIYPPSRAGFRFQAEKILRTGVDIKFLLLQRRRRRNRVVSFISPLAGQVGAPRREGRFRLRNVDFLQRAHPYLSLGREATQVSKLYQNSLGLIFSHRIGIGHVGPIRLVHAPYLPDTVYDIHPVSR